VKTKLVLGVTGVALAGLVAAAAPAAATSHTSSTLRGTTAVTTAPGIATTLLGQGVLPLPLPGTGIRIGFSGGLTVTYRFPITSGNADLASLSGDIFHSGGINFVSFRAHLSIADFDINLPTAKVYATKVNGAAARVPILDLNISGLKVTSVRDATVLSGIKLYLDPAAAGAVNSTFHLSLPTDGSLLFGTATVTLRS
jgi:hypothetical protein